VQRPEEQEPRQPATGASLLQQQQQQRQQQQQQWRPRRERQQMRQLQQPPRARQRAGAAAAAGAAARPALLAAACALLAALLLPATAADIEPDYAQLFGNSFLFYEAQQSGELPEWNRMARNSGGWRADAHLNDGAAVNLELSGGLYAQGGYVKATVPIAYTASMLAWAFIEFPKVGCCSSRCSGVRRCLGERSGAGGCWRTSGVAAAVGGGCCNAQGTVGASCRGRGAAAAAGRSA
jgi:hypothetical protein